MSTIDLSELWWENLPVNKRFELMRKYDVKSYSRKAVSKMYLKEKKESKIS